MLKFLYKKNIMSFLKQFTMNRLSPDTLSSVKGGMRYFTKSQVERRRKRRQLRKMGIAYTDAVITCPVTGERTYCVEW